MARIAKSLAFQERAKLRIPGMTQLLSKRPDLFSQGVWPGYYRKARGVHVWDLDDNRYVDMSISGIGANVLGYADPEVDDAVHQAISNGVSCSLNCTEEVELAELLCELHPWAEMVRFTRSGGEAMAVAVRISRAYTRRDKVAFCGYHGWHDWYMAANLGTANALGEHLIAGLDPAGVPMGLKGSAFPFRYNRLEELVRIANDHGKDLAAIVMEPIRNVEPQADFIAGVRSIAEETGAVLIVDEISAGFRFLTGGAHLRIDPGLPDVAVFSKALGNGYPIAAVIGKDRIMEAAQTTFISSTNWTERIGPTAALATLKKHRRENVGDHLQELGQEIQQCWRSAAEKHGLSIHVGGIKPCSHFVFEHEQPQALKAYFIQLMLEKGFLASNLFYAMHAHQRTHVAEYAEAVDEVFGLIAETIDQNDLSTKLIGHPASVGFQRLN